MLRIGLACLLFLSLSSGDASIQTVQRLCCEGDLERALSFTSSLLPASERHSLMSVLSFVLHGDRSAAASHLAMARQLNASMPPPLVSLAELGDCQAMSDLFFVSTAIVMESGLSNATRQAVQGHKTLVTLASDVGLHSVAETHLSRCLELTRDPEVLLRSVLMLPAVYESASHLHQTRTLLSQRLQDTLNSGDALLLEGLTEFSFPPTFNLVYQGYIDRDYLMQLNELYRRAHPPLHGILIEKDTWRRSGSEGRINIGFVSSYFRKHSVCKLFCGLISNMDINDFNVIVFSSTSPQDEDEYTRSLMKRTTFVRVGKTFIQNRYLVVERRVDVLIYLDIGMDPSIKLWASARLAPIQVALLFYCIA